ncbi:MAG: NUDIX hydrolase [Deltaproteobacteria bacterium]|nr:NUDIX hydrolase [Deltaproteobacteria bacterium]
MHHGYTFRFCPVCGAKLISSTLKEFEPARLVCSQCHFIFYLDPKLVACVIVEMNGKIVLLKRAIEPQKGKWVVPGGYVDRGEVVDAAALRETREECGIDIRIKRLLGVYSYPGTVEAMVFYIAEYTGGDLVNGDEVFEAKLVEPNVIPWEDLAFQSTTDALKDYCSFRGVKQ